MVEGTGTRDGAGAGTGDAVGAGTGESGRGFGRFARLTSCFEFPVELDLAAMVTAAGVGGATFGVGGRAGAEIDSVGGIGEGTGAGVGVRAGEGAGAGVGVGARAGVGAGGGVAETVNGVARPDGGRCRVFDSDAGDVTDAEVGEEVGRVGGGVVARVEAEGGRAARVVGSFSGEFELDDEIGGDEVKPFGLVDLGLVAADGGEPDELPITGAIPLLELEGGL